MAKRKPPRPADRSPTGQDREVGREVRQRGLLARVNEVLRPEGYVLAFLYGQADDPDQVGPFEVKIERVPDGPRQDGADRGGANLAH